MILLYSLTLTLHLPAQVNHHIREFIEKKNFLKMHETWEENRLPLPQVTVDSLIGVFSRVKSISDEYDPPENVYFEEPSEVYFIDFNHDGLTDILYPTVYGIPFVKAFIGTKDSFISVLQEDLCYPTAIKWRGNKCKEIVLDQPVYLAQFVSQYFFTFKKDSFYFNYGRRTMEQLPPPDRYYKRPRHFRTTYSASLRDKPAEGKPDWEEEYEGDYDFYYVSANIMVLYSRGTRGTAWGESIDSAGEKWLLVEMPMLKNAGDDIRAFFYWEEEHKEPMYNVGWMKAGEIGRRFD